MAKKQADETTIRKSKEELLDIMYKHLKNQEELAQKKWESTILAEESGELDLNINKRTKKENTDLKEYNMQVTAISRTVASILQIQKSEMPTVNDEEEDGDSEELV